MPDLKLSHHVKFRAENGYVLICHCKRLQDFRVSPDGLPFLEQLASTGVPADQELSRYESRLLDDLRKVHMLVDDADPGAEIDLEPAKVWERLAYDGEF